MPLKRVSRSRTPDERRRSLWIHLVIYLIVNSGLIAINVTQQPGKLWFYWPLCGWGLGLLLHARMVYRRRERKQQP